MKIIIHTPLLNGCESHIGLKVISFGKYRVSVERYKDGYLQPQYSVHTEMTCHELERQLRGLTNDNASGYYDNGDTIDFRTLVF